MTKTKRREIIVHKTMANNAKELSIQITLGGFSFFINTHDTLRGGTVDSYELDSALTDECYELDAHVQWSVPGVLIIPYELFDHNAVDAYLQSASLMDPSFQHSLFAVHGDYVAVWAVEQELYDYITHRLPHATHSHALLSAIGNCDKRTGVIALELDDAETLHIAAGAPSGIAAARSLVVTSFEDVLFYALQAAPLGQGSRVVVGDSDGAEELAAYLKNYFIAVQIR